MVVHFHATEHPTAQWAAQQIVEAFPFDETPRFLLRDRDDIYGAHFQQWVRNMGMEEVVTAPRSPWQNPLPRPIQAPSEGHVVAMPCVGGLHHGSRRMA